MRLHEAEGGVNISIILHDGEIDDPTLLTRRPGQISREEARKDSSGSGRSPAWGMLRAQALKNPYPGTDQLRRHRPFDVC